MLVYVTLYFYVITYPAALVVAIPSERMCMYTGRPGLWSGQVANIQLAEIKGQLADNDVNSPTSR